ncbi:SDR family oxidoreductase [Rhodococcus sp. WS4]|nr:SDR family oxidoreductase [Rhodococcus sp. WS4]
MVGDLDGRRIVITGAASGVGAGLVAGLTERGARVVGFDLDAEAGQANADKHGTGFAACDISDPESVATAFQEADRVLGGLDCFINAAGVAPAEAAASTPLELWELCHRVNATGTFLTNLKAFERLKDNGGRIINFASAAGMAAYPSKAAYAASKGSVLAWVRTIAVEWAPFGITVNAIGPLMWTSMYDKTRAGIAPENLPAHDAQIKSIIPMGRMGQVESDLVPVLAFLAGEGSGFITGQTIMIDGGQTQVR